MCYEDDLVITTPTLESHIDRLDEVFGSMKRAGLNCKPSKFENPLRFNQVPGKNGGQAWRKAGPGSSGGGVDLEGPQNGHTALELPGVCQLLP